MKKYLLLAMLFAVLMIQACDKMDGIVFPRTMRDAYSLAYAPSYTTNVGIATTVASFSIIDSLHRGTRFTLTPQDLPAGVTVSPDSISTTDALPVKFYFSTNFATSGHYPVSINCTGPGRYAKKITFDLIAEPVIVTPDCSTGLNGNWNVYDSGWAAPLSPSHYTGYVQITSRNKLQLVLLNYNINCDLTCTSSTMTSQPFTGTTGGSAGTGSFSTNRMEITYTVYSGSGNYKVTSILTR